MECGGAVARYRFSSIRDSNETEELECHPEGAQLRPKDLNRSAQLFLARSNQASYKRPFPLLPFHHPRI
jgi:hypothetical protein